MSDGNTKTSTSGSSKNDPTSSNNNNNKIRNGDTNSRRTWYGQDNRQRLGGPAILLTCEQGREIKCEREAIDMLTADWEAKQYGARKCSSDTTNDDRNHYIGAAANAVVAAEEVADCGSNKLSLEDELQQLREVRQVRAKQQRPRLFTVNNVASSRGTVFLMCTQSKPLIGCSQQSTAPLGGQPATKKAKTAKTWDVTEPRKYVKGNNETTKAKKDSDNADGLSVNELADEETRARASDVAAVSTVALQHPHHSDTISEEYVPTWDPVLVVDRLMQGIRDNRADSVSSRFILRMIPLQVTCQASLSDIQHTVRELLLRTTATNDRIGMSSSSSVPSTEQILPPPPTFAIVTKRRLCGHLERKRIIDTVAAQVIETCPTWTVNLNQPDYTVAVEVCKTIAGISIVPGHPRYNFAELREEIVADHDDDK
jgi:tRNA(Ser,Leu) C12 N-acetylase TAN1